MIRRATAALLTAGLFAGVSAPGLAQDGDTRGDTQRLEVPEAGVSVSFPASWGASVEMREKEDWGLYDEGFADAPVAFWNVIYASDGGRPWCDLVWYPSHPLTIEQHAQRYEALMTPSHSEVERPIEVEPVSLPAGEATRFHIYNEPTDDHTTLFLLGVDDSRYLLQCVSDERAEDDWMSMADSLELLETAGDGSDTSIEKE